MSAVDRDETQREGEFPAGRAEQRAERRADAGVAGNARLTAANAAVLLVLLAIEGVSGVGLLLVTGTWLSLLLTVHKGSFVLWFGAMTVHVLGHLSQVFRLAPRDWMRRTRREVTGAGARQWLIAASLVAGVLLGYLLLSQVNHWLSAAPAIGH